MMVVDRHLFVRKFIAHFSRQLVRSRVGLDISSAVVAISVAIVLAYCVAMVVSGVREGGFGDESHRLVIAYRMELSIRAFFDIFFNQPWPPLPYIIQKATFEIMRKFGVINISFMKVAICVSIMIFGMHLLLVIDATRRLRVSLSGLCYVFAAISSPYIIQLATSAMGEIYALFFLALALWSYSWMKPKGFVWSAAICFLLASLCRSEVSVFAIPVFFIIMRVYGFYKGFVFLSVALLSFYLKTLYWVFFASETLSYLNLDTLYNFDTSIYARALASWSSFVESIRSSSGFDRWISIIFILAVAAAVIKRFVYGQWVLPRYVIPFSVISFGMVAVVFLLNAGGKILVDKRYYTIPLLSLVLTVAFMMPGDTPRTSGRRNGCAIMQRALRVFLAIFGLAQIPVSLSRIPTFVPQELVETVRVLNRIASNERVVAIDALMFWDGFVFAHAVINAGANKSAMVYDLPNIQLFELEKKKFDDGESPKVMRMHAYIAQYKPNYIVLAGKDYREQLDSIKFFLDKEERQSYIERNIIWDGESKRTGRIVLENLAQGSKIRIELLHENTKAKIYHAVYD